MKHGKTLQELAAEITRRNEVKEDFIVDTRQVEMIDEGGGKLSFGGNCFEINEIAHGQIANKLKIPHKYYDRMLTEQPELLVHNVNTWLSKEPSRRMVRTLDGTAERSCRINTAALTTMK